MAHVLLEAMPQVPEEYCRMHLAKYKNSGTGAFTDLEPMLALTTAILVSLFCCRCLRSLTGG
jgi:hypothetical protein